MKTIEEQIKYTENVIDSLEKKAKVVIDNGPFKLKIAYHKSILKTLKHAENKHLTVIKSYILPLTLENKLKIPRGSILGVSKQTYQLKNGKIEDRLYLSVKFHHEEDLVEHMVYVIPDGTPMLSTLSVGKYYGTFSVSGNLVHVFDKLFQH